MSLVVPRRKKYFRVLIRVQTWEDFFSQEKASIPFDIGDTTIPILGECVVHKNIKKKKFKKN